MRMLAIELRKEKRTGVTAILLAAGGIGALYAWANFLIRADTLLSLPLPPMDVLLTQLYGMVMIFNLFAIVTAATMIYNMEFCGAAIQKMLILPLSVSRLYFCKFLILCCSLLGAFILQNLALICIGMRFLPQGGFEPATLLCFGGYTYLTALPVLSFMLLISSRSENIWIPLGVGVAGFLSAMALANGKSVFLLLHPFVVMLRPAVALRAEVDLTVLLMAVSEAIAFLAVGLWMAKYRQYE